MLSFVVDRKLIFAKRTRGFFYLLFVDVAKITDDDLLRSISQKDEAALAALYDRYRTILFSLLVRILRDRAEAEDVLQDTFVKVWQRANEFDSQRGKAFTWLVILARSRALDRLRAIRSRDRTAEKASRYIISLNSDLTENAIHKRRNNFIQTALNELPEEQRNILLMAYFEGYSQSEIAALTNTPLGTIKTKMRTAMTALREAQNHNLRSWL